LVCVRGPQCEWVDLVTVGENASGDLMR
jgi:hypothetical protein